MANQPSILVIDDERQIRKLLDITLVSAGYMVTEAATGQDGLIKAAMHPPDLILLDLGLPDEDGQNILERLREWYLAPVIILTVRNLEEEIIRALDNGANDYVVKPFRTGELHARIRNAMNRAVRDIEGASVIKSGSLSIDFSSRSIKKNGVDIKLTSTEYSLMSLLAKNHDKVLTHQFILKEIWGPGFIEQSQYLHVYIAQIRKKIEDNPDNPAIILTESRIGYRFVVC